MKKNGEKCFVGLRLQTCSRKVTVSKELNLLNEFLLHVTARAVSARDALNCTSSPNYSQLCQMGVPHTKAENACCWKTLVISWVSVRNNFFCFTSVIVSTFWSHLLLRVLFSFRKRHIFHFTFTFAGLEECIFPTVRYPSKNRHFALSARSQKVNSVELPIRNWHGHTSVR